MFTLIEQLVQGLVSGLAGPVSAYLKNRQDTNLDGFKTAAGLDQQAYANYLQYLIQVNAQKAAANSWWGARLLYMIAGGSAVIHFAAVMLDSVPFGIPFVWSHVVGSWRIPSPPGVYATYEGWIIGSLFVVTVGGPMASAVTSWLHKK